MAELQNFGFIVVQNLGNVIRAKPDYGKEHKIVAHFIDDPNISEIRVMDEVEIIPRKY
ncbi:MAG: hypothetical protein QXO67_01025 [Candidatus Bathyarchaeia archaeon]